MTILLVAIMIMGLGYAFHTWLVSRNEYFTITFGKQDGKIDPAFPTLNLLNVDVLYQVDSTYPETPDGIENDSYIAYSGTAVFSFKNINYKECLIHLPLLRAGFLSPNSNEFIFYKDMQSVWRQNKTITLKPGESFEISHQISGFTSNHKIFCLEDGADYCRWELVFGVPDGENPDQYIVGTVITNQIHWASEKTKKPDRKGDEDNRG